MLDHVLANLDYWLQIPDDLGMHCGSKLDFLFMVIMLRPAKHTMPKAQAFYFQSPWHCTYT